MNRIAVLSKEFLNACYQTIPSRQDISHWSFWVAKMILQRPLWKTVSYVSKEFSSYRDNSDGLQRIKNTFATIVVCGCSPLSVTLGLLSTPFTGFSYLIREKDYFHILGRGQPLIDFSHIKIMTWNICRMTGMSIIFGGVMAGRIKELVQQIKLHEPSFLCLQEVGYEEALQLCEQLKDLYTDFHFEPGFHLWKQSSGLLIATKGKPVQKPEFIEFTSFNVAIAGKKGSQPGIRRGFFVVEMKDFYLINTHLDPHSERDLVRDQQFDEIKGKMNQFDQNKSVFLAGDFNLDQLKITEYNKIPSRFCDPNKDSLEPTATDNLDDWAKGKEKRNINEKLDYILLDKKSENKWNLTTKRLDPHWDDPKAALSDHAALLLEAKKAHFD
ncbi:MAG: endonuclease/exonuclease/phosphatase family protein [Chlamydiae bacterium]|nr:endonuclease/exonuclease/phosphatase family protein [Chlamydiota bacterium]